MNWSKSMNPMLLSAVLLGSPANATTNDLFAALDRDADGRVTATEVAEQQRPFFDRALRVADRNEDGALSADELSAATSSPRPTTLPSPGFGGRGGMPGGAGRMDIDGLKALDRNKDNEITLDEVPAAMKPRIQEILERTGRKSLSMEMLERFSGSYRPGQTGRSDEMKDAEDSEMKSERAGKTDSQDANAGKSGKKATTDNSKDSSITIEPKKSSQGGTDKSAADQLRARLRAKMQAAPRRKKP